MINIVVLLLCVSRSLEEPAQYSLALSQLESGLLYLYENFNNSTGLYNNVAWWNNANIQETMLDAVVYFRKHKNATQTNWDALTKKTIDITYKKHVASAFINNSYVDGGWWALAWLKAYDVYNNDSYLQVSRTIFLDMTRGWDSSVCGGGLWADKQRSAKKAIVNELMLALSTRLYMRTNETVFYDWFTKLHSWFLHSNLINADWLINEGLNSSDPKACTNNRGTTWTHNQGVILSALADMAKIQKNNAMIALGEKIIDATLQKLKSGATLVEPCEVDSQGCSPDASQYKGIFMKNLAYFCYLSTESVIKYQTPIRTQANTILNYDSKVEGDTLVFGLHYGGPFDKADCSRQSSAIDAILANLRTE